VYEGSSGIISPFFDFQKFRTSEGGSSRSETSRTGRGRRSIFAGARAANDTNSIISRSDFIERYPFFLIQVISVPDELMLVSSRRGVDEPGVDICFKNLSLAVKVADKTINVVDKVTGRVQAKTMTALMGGSGAGELHDSTRY
jgi:hypothetical protein